MSRRARWAVGLVLPAALVAGLASSCSAPEPAADSPTAVVAPAADCLSARVLADLGLVSAGESAETGTPHADAPDTGRVPDDFRAASVVVCSPGGTLHDSSGTWVALTASWREGDLDPLVAALRRPSAPRGGTCSTAAVVPPALWLVDALGRAIRPVWPTDRCGSPEPAVADALDALEETDSEQYPVRLIAPADEATTSP
ncbi:hypothetical protein [Cellulomonas sp. Root137]|uniref:hypothetical protein n=1 Tax=Cellulomonas sp. Root137 TaxID=1736459 RepID=UPI00070A0895|nr:hypothetical protein [Cellulomonas sp. Root137]KQY47271.1 hypothetical protein ASD18_07920 [Cellulomonas sp. Root137]KRD44413.1 hypothetical protein ASE38_09825 [Cellulomonas sp. Root930]